jgi:hypothetical protein
MKTRTKKAAVSSALAFGAKLAFDLKDPLSMGGSAKPPAPAVPKLPLLSAGAGPAPRTPLLSVPDPRLSAPKPMAAQPTFTPTVSGLSTPQLKPPAPAAASAPPPPSKLPIDLERKLRQSAVDEEQTRLRQREQMQYGDWWGGKNQSPTGRFVGERVMYPAVTSAADVANRTYLTGKNMALRGASLGAGINAGVGQIGKFVTSPWSAPQPLNPQEQADYKQLQSVLTLGNRALTPEELARSADYDKRQRAFEAERERQDYWDTYSTRSINDMDKMDATGRETTRMIEEGIAPNAPRVETVTGPGGQQQVVVHNEEPINQLQRELTEAAGPNSLASRIGNVSYGVGDFAMQQVPTAVATAGLGTTLGALGKVAPRGGQLLQTTGQMLNPAMGQLFPNTASRIGAGVGMGIGAYNAADDIANAQTREEQIAAGQGLGSNLQLGAFGGGMIGAGVPALARGYERMMYPNASAALPAVSPTMAPAVAEAAPATGGLASTAGTYGTQFGSAVAAGAVEGTRAGEGARNDFVTQQVQPSEQVAIEQGQALQTGDTSGLGQLNPDRLPQAFHADAARVNAGFGTGQVGSPAVVRPGETEGEYKAVPTLQDSDFFRYAQEQAFTPEGQAGPLETQAAQAGQSAFDTTLAATGSRAQADQAREVAYKDTYVKSYQADQQAQFDTSREEFEKLIAAPDADPAAVNDQFGKTVTHLLRANPDKAEEAKKFVEDAQRRASGDEAPPDPQAQAFEEKTRENYVAQAAAVSPPPPAAQNNPQSFGAFTGGLIESFNNLPTEAKAAIGIGLPLALVGMMMNSGDEGSGLGGILLSLLGLSVAGVGAAGSGMLGDNAQKMVGGGIKSLAGMFGAQVPEKQDLSALLSQDVVADVNKQVGAGGGWMDKIRSAAGAAMNPEAAKAKLQQVEQLKKLTSLPSFIAVPLLREIDPQNIKTTEQAQLAYNNAMRLRRALDNPESPLAQAVATGQAAFGS